MTWLVLALHVVIPACWKHQVTVTAADMRGHEVKYSAEYWLCHEGARPATVGPVIPLCSEDGNPYARVLWALPWFGADLKWLCEAPE